MKRFSLFSLMIGLLILVGGFGLKDKVLTDEELLDCMLIRAEVNHHGKFNRISLLKADSLNFENSGMRTSEAAGLRLLKDLKYVNLWGTKIKEINVSYNYYLEELHLPYKMNVITAVNNPYLNLSSLGKFKLFIDHIRPELKKEMIANGTWPYPIIEE